MLSYITQGKNFVLSNAQRASLESIARAENEYSGFARTIYYLLTGHRIKIDLPHLIPVTPRSREENTSSSMYSSYPNPVINNEHIVDIKHGKDNDKLEIRMSDLMGRIVIVKTASIGENILDLSSVSNGLYLIEVVNNQQSVFTNKIVKM